MGDYIIVCPARWLIGLTIAGGAAIISFSLIFSKAATERSKRVSADREIGPQTESPIRKRHPPKFTPEPTGESRRYGK